MSNGDLFNATGLASPDVDYHVTPDNPIEVWREAEIASYGEAAFTPAQDQRIQAWEATGEFPPDGAGSTTPSAWQAYRSGEQSSQSDMVTSQGDPKSMSDVLRGLAADVASGIRAGPISPGAPRSMSDRLREGEASPGAQLQAPKPNAGWGAFIALLLAGLTLWGFWKS